MVLAVFVVQHLQPENELWITIGTGKGLRHLPAHEIAAGLGPDEAQAHTMFHSLTGCDTVSSLADHGKVEEDRSRLDCVPRSNMCTFEVFVATN